MPRRITLTLTVVAAFVALALPAAAAPTCAGVFGSDIANHGEHIVGDYVTGLGGIGGGLGWPPNGQVGGGGGAVLPGGPGPAFHFPNGFAPGASFCIEQRPAFTTPGPFQP